MEFLSSGLACRFLHRRVEIWIEFPSIKCLDPSSNSLYIASRGCHQLWISIQFEVTTSHVAAAGKVGGWKKATTKTGIAIALRSRNVLFPASLLLIPLHSSQNFSTTSVLAYAKWQMTYSHVILRSHAPLNTCENVSHFISSLKILSVFSELSQSAMDSDDELEQSSDLIPKPTDFFNKIVFLQADLIYNAISFLAAPISTFLSLLSESFHRAEEAKCTVESAVRKSPTAVAHRLSLGVRRVSYGVVAAGFMCMVMVVLLVAAASVSGLAIRFWMEEPVELWEKLNFDYTQARPRALFGVDYRSEMKKKKKNLGIPVGHTVFVSLILLMPESDFNREVGVFQLSAELISTNGNIITSSSQPCMLRFRSTPVRFTRTFLTSVPLLLGISTESQKLTFPILKHKEENYQRSGAIQVTITPRVGTLALPELYEAHILIKSKLPKTKELLRRWRWTCFLWTSLYLYLMFLVLFVFFWKPVMFRAATLAELSGFNRGAPTIKEAEESFDEMEEITVELLRKWQEIRRKRKAVMFEYGEVGEEDVGSTSASSISCSREYIAAVFEEDVGDSESVLLEGSE